MSLLSRLRSSLPQKPANTGLIGLDCALESLHLVQFDRAHELGVTARAKASLPYPQPLQSLIAKPGLLKGPIRETLRYEGFHGDRIVSTMPIEQTSILSLSYRMGSGQNEARVIAELMKERIEGELSDWVIDYIPIRQSTAEDRLALVAYAKRRDVIAYLEMWRKCGLEVAALEIRPAAIKRLVYMMSGATLWNAMTINFGRERSFLTLFSGRRVLYDQAIEFGETQMLGHLVDELDLPVELLRQMAHNQDILSGSGSSGGRVMDLNVNINEVFQEIFRPALRPVTDAVDRALIFAASETRGEPVREIFLLGSIARWVGIEKLMQTLLHLPVLTIPDPLFSIRGGTRPGEAVQEPGAPEIAVAAGLALKDLLPNV